MSFLKKLIVVAGGVAVFALAQASETAEQQFARVSKAGAGEVVGQAIELDVDLATSPGFSVEVAGDRAVVRYRMAFNQIAEGWSWRPLANVAVDDYYRFKFLPLQSVSVERGEYAHEDKIGVTQQMKVSWRYDYFLAFENLYDFYPRNFDDEAGFSADLPAGVVGHLGLRAKANLIEPVTSESTTFWKATYGKPTDFTLKKRYFVGEMTQISFVDSESGETLCRISKGQDHCSAR